ncbi:uncharacterized protein LOC135214103 [Macrobrachium nipponense]|uniref:uncharacterized protein LOC135214103 n=1 Tax=Macrobrachium nipponense TaxID=159736 RepID=UPI0030C85D97
MRAQITLLLALGVAMVASDRKPFGIQLPAFGSPEPQQYHLRPTLSGSSSSDYFIFGSPLGSGHVLDGGRDGAGGPAAEAGGGAAVTRGEASDIQSFSATFSQGFVDLPEYETFASPSRFSFRKSLDDSRSEEDDDDDDDK